ncbi:MFS transporter [Pandoraea soli]|uniref:4-hydroxybenzoate transporter n=1 Tax=Pandoraea soli TaxID=2508293 RepID=A0ABY6W0A6_9BURK|nr:MFS transporter [Pandoraea soli]VVE10759.1 4-hydroxybenzoate transporter [Pandoraea soli]
MTDVSSSTSSAGETRRARGTWSLAFTAFLVMAVDGFDTAAISYVAPTLAVKWQVPSSALAPTFVMTSIGAVAGYLASGAAVSRFGRQKVVATAMICFAILSLASVLAGSVWEMAGFRFFTAFFLGLIVPAIIAGISMAVSDSHRSTVTAAVTTGMSVGAAVGGGVAAILIGKFDWHSVFIAGGILPVLLLPAVFRTMSDDVSLESLSRRRSTAIDQTESDVSPVVLLLHSPYRTTTVLIWSVSCLGFFVAYALLFWMPTFLTSFGFSPARAALGTMAVSAGGGLGSLLLILSVKRVGVETVLMALLAIGILSFAIIGGTHLSEGGIVLSLTALIGAATGTICIGQAVLAVRTYPLTMRTTGVGFAAAAGRLGSIFGPGAVGMLLASGLQPQEILLWCVVPAVALAGLLVVLRRRTRTVT